jgi:hypothetical protein
MHFTFRCYWYEQYQQQRMENEQLRTQVNQLTRTPLDTFRVIVEA